MLSRRIVTTGGVTAGVGLLVAAPAAACTILVGSTTGTSGAAPGSPVAAEGEVYHGDGTNAATGNFGEQASPCSDFGADNDETDAECLYSLGVVNPSEVHDPSGGDTGDTYYSDTCHYGTPQSSHPSQFATIADHDEVEHLPAEDSDDARILAGEGILPAVDDEGRPMETGETVMCFYSSEKPDDGDGGQEVNLGDNGAATATVPQPFVVLNP